MFIPIWTENAAVCSCLGNVIIPSNNSSLKTEYSVIAGLYRICVIKYRVLRCSICYLFVICLLWSNQLFISVALAIDMNLTSAVLCRLYGGTGRLERNYKDQVMKLTYKIDQTVRKISSPVVICIGVNRRQFKNGADLADYSFDRCFVISDIIADGSTIFITLVENTRINDTNWTGEEQAGFF